MREDTPLLRRSKKSAHALCYSLFKYASLCGVVLECTLLAEKNYDNFVIKILIIDLIRIFGSEDIVNQIIDARRQITYEQAMMLGKLFSVDPNLFLTHSLSR